MRKIDLGCGPCPKAGYDIYTDIYMHPKVRDNPEVSNRFVKTAMEDMPMFKDKEFDYAYSHHVLEHVQDPNKACAEMVRIAKAGILYFPTVEIDILIGRHDHNWLIFPDYKRNHLLFIKKRFKSYFGQGGKNKIEPEEAAKWVAQQNKPFEWKDSFTWTVVL
ncbi:MAG TPA: class I SAM-dependent methyltransferase [Candidatus Glassbacteria bacterium]|nr:class I SAM-dependent methyltransferase [Candidatus Glassbacteria bacterium]